MGVIKFADVDRRLLFKYIMHCDRSMYWYDGIIQRLMEGVIFIRARRIGCKGIDDWINMQPPIWENPGMFYR